MLPEARLLRKRIAGTVQTMPSTVFQIRIRLQYTTVFIVEPTIVYTEALHPTPDLPQIYSFRGFVDKIIQDLRLNSETYFEQNKNSTVLILEGTLFENHVLDKQKRYRWVMIIIVCKTELNQKDLFMKQRKTTIPLLIRISCLN